MSRHCGPGGKVSVSLATSHRVTDGLGYVALQSGLGNADHGDPTSSCPCILPLVALFDGGRPMPIIPINVYNHSEFRYKQVIHVLAYAVLLNGAPSHRVDRFSNDALNARLSGIFEITLNRTETAIRLRGVPELLVAVVALAIPWRATAHFRAIGTAFLRWMMECIAAALTNGFCSTGGTAFYRTVVIPRCVTSRNGKCLMARRTHLTYRRCKLLAFSGAVRSFSPVSPRGVGPAMLTRRRLLLARIGLPPCQGGASLAARALGMNQRKATIYA